MSRPTPACSADLACYRNDGHDGEHAYADGRNPEPVADTAGLREAVIEQARLVSQWAGAIGSGPIEVLDEELAELRRLVLALAERGTE